MYFNMRSSENSESSSLDTKGDHQLSLSIIIDDFDSSCDGGGGVVIKSTPNTMELKISTTSDLNSISNGKSYSRQSSDASIKKILEEAEHRKHEFWKLIDEHNAVIENLKKIEQENNETICKMAHQQKITT